MQWEVRRSCAPWCPAACASCSLSAYCVTCFVFEREPSFARRAGCCLSAMPCLQCWLAHVAASTHIAAVADPSADGGSAVPASAANGAAGSADSCGCAAHAACGGGCGQPTCGCGGSCGQPACGCGGGGTPAGQRMHPDASEPAAAAKKDLHALLAGVARSTAELLQRVELPELERLLGETAGAESREPVWAAREQLSRLRWHGCRVMACSRAALHVSQCAQVLL